MSVGLRSHYSVGHMRFAYFAVLIKMLLILSYNQAVYSALFHSLVPMPYLTRLAGYPLTGNHQCV